MDEPSLGLRHEENQKTSSTRSFLGLDSATMPNYEADPPLSKAQYLDAIGRLHQFQISRYDSRRQLEWRLTFTIWGGLLLGANALRDVRVPDDFELAIWVALLGVVVLHAWWEYTYVNGAAKNNREAVIALEQEARHVLGLPPANIGGYSALSSHYWQVGVTLILGLVVAAVMFWG